MSPVSDDTQSRSGTEREISRLKAQRKVRVTLLAVAFALLSATVISLFALVTSPLNTIGYSLAFTSGVSMIFLPCALPMVLLVVPLSVSGGSRRGLLIAAAFGIGVTVALLIFGLFTASLGGYFGLNQSVRMILVIAGVFAYALSMSMIGLFKIEMPVNVKVPGLLGRGKYYVAPFFFGLLLGDAGIGCPNPAFYLLLASIASTADLAQGAVLGVLHGFGRAVPLMFLSALALLGTNLSISLARNVGKLYVVTGVVMLFISSWILTVGMFGDFFELLVFHDMWDNAIYAALGAKAAEQEIEFLHLGTLGSGWQYALWIMLALFAAPLSVWLMKGMFLRRRLASFRLRMPFRGATVAKIVVLTVITVSLVSYVGNSPAATVTFDELKAMGFPYREAGELSGIELIAIPKEGQLPLTVEFGLVPTFGVMKNVAVQYWEWGDGFVSGSGGTRHTYTYNSPGVYEVTVTIYAGGGCGIAPTVFEKTTIVKVT